MTTKSIDPKQDAPTLRTNAVRQSPLSGRSMMTREFGQVRFSLTWKLFLAVAVLFVLLIAITVAWTGFRAHRLAHESIETGLNQTRTSFERFQEDQFDKLRFALTAVVDDPALKAALAETDAATLLDRAEQHQKVIGADFVIYTDAQGIVLARTDKPSYVGKSMAQSPIIQKALSGEPGVGIGREADGGLIYTVAMPISSDQVVSGAMQAGKKIDDTVASALKSSTQSEAAFVSFDPRENAATAFGLAAVASTLSGPPADLVSALKAQKSMLQHLGPEAQPQGPLEIELGGERYTAILDPIKTSSEQVVGAYIGLRSQARELEVFDRILQSLLIAGAVAVALAFIVATLMARKLTKPIRDLVGATQFIKQGEYDKVVVPEHSQDEIGVLARAFKSMVAELMEKAELERYLAEMTARPLAMVAGVEQPAGAVTQARGVTMGSGPMSTIAIGSVIGERYEIQAILGQGGMGTVFQARDKALDEIVALKTLREDAMSMDPTSMDRFKQEIKLARRITHKNVLKTFDFGELANFKYLSMEFVRGSTVKSLIQAQQGDHGLPMGAALRISKQLCSALAAAHEVGVIHRDVKPQNMLLDATGELKIMDFGISRLAGNKGLTSTGMVMGTPDYMSPEQAQGTASDHRADIYSVGVVMYELFTGKLPFISDNPVTVVLKHVQEKAAAPRSVNAKIPEALETIIVNCMEKDPAKRPATMADVYNDLSSLTPR